VWGALEEFMTKYHGLLDGRARLIEDTNRLRSQNDELKMLLNQCAPPPPPRTHAAPASSASHRSAAAAWVGAPP